MSELSVNEWNRFLNARITQDGDLRRCIFPRFELGNVEGFNCLGLISIPPHTGEVAGSIPASPTIPPYPTLKIHSR